MCTWKHIYEIQLSSSEMCRIYFQAPSALKHGNCYYQKKICTLHLVRAFFRFKCKLWFMNSKCCLEVLLISKSKCYKFVFEKHVVVWNFCFPQNTIRDFTLACDKTAIKGRMSEFTHFYKLHKRFKWNEIVRKKLKPWLDH